MVHLIQSMVGSNLSVENFQWVERDEPLSAAKRTTVMRRPWSLVANRYIFVHSASCLMQYTFLYLFILYCIMCLDSSTDLFLGPFSTGDGKESKTLGLCSFGFFDDKGSVLFGFWVLSKIRFVCSLSCVNIEFGSVLGKPGFWFGYQQCPEFLLWKT